MITCKDSDRAFWSLVLDYSRNITGISKFVFDGAYHHLPVMSKDQFNSVKRLSKSACVLGNIALTMLAKLNDNESSSHI